MTTFLPPDNDTEEANCLIFPRRVSMLPSSEPLMIIKSESSSLQIAFATVVLPRPAVPARIILSISPPSTIFLKVCFKSSGRIHSSMVVGRYFSTQRNSSDTKILQVHFACLIHNDKRWLKPTMQLIILDHLIPKVNTDISKIISRIQFMWRFVLSIFFNIDL